MDSSDGDMEDEAIWSPDIKQEEGLGLLSGDEGQPWRSRGECSRRERCLCALLVMVTLGMSGLGAALLVTNWTAWVGRPVCESPDCVILSGTAIRKMSVAVDPCSNFYEYACGAYPRSPEVPPNIVKYTPLETMQLGAYGKIKRALDEPTLFQGINSTAIWKARRYYHHCMNSSATELRGAEPLLKLLKYVGGWPVLNATWVGEEWRVERAVAEIRKLGVVGLIHIDVTVDNRDNSQQRVALDQPGLLLPSSNEYTDPSLADGLRPLYINYVSDMAQLLGADPQRAQQAAKQIWDFEVQLAKILDPAINRTDPRSIYHLATLQEMQASIDQQFHLQDLVESFLGVSVEDSELVITYAEGYIQRMAKLLSNTDKEVIANYIGWRLATGFHQFLPVKFSSAGSSLRRKLFGASTSTMPWQLCTSLTDGAMSYATSALYVSQTFSSSAKQQVVYILESLRDAFIAHLSTVSWMDDVTKAAAREKALAISEKIGFPDFILDPVKLDAYYEKMDLSGETALELEVGVRLFDTWRTTQRRGQPNNKDRWLMSPTSVNAYYTPNLNQMVFPAAILQPPLYKTTYPTSWVYGSIGFVMGHELTHGFDNKGREFDKKGNMFNWWTDQSEKKFRNETLCIIDQYDHSEVYGKFLDGRTTLAENIADNGGIKVALQAYNAWLQSTTDVDPILPALNATHKQLFFLGFAQTWCTFATPEYAKQAVDSDSHSNNIYRVINTLKNTPEFSKAFNCPVNSTMNPTTKCSVW